MWLLLILFGVPLIEIALFIEVGGLIGVLPTILLCILSAVAGSALMRSQGLATLDRLRASVEAGGDPRGPIANGALILVAGVLLNVPGFFTDAIGLHLLIPPDRRQVVRWGASRLAVRAAGFVRPGHASRPGPADTIEADYEVVEPGPVRRHGSSGWTRPNP
jgi:UPF0716 protein FxsA